MNEALDPRPLGDVTKVSRRCCVCDEVLARGVLGHRIIRQAGKKDDLIHTSQVALLDVEHVFACCFGLFRKVATKPEEIDHLNVVAPLEELR